MSANTESMIARDALSSRVANADGGEEFTRVSVRLGLAASQALVRACEVMGHSKTDTINRALQVYSYLTACMEEDGGKLILRKNSGEEQLIRFF